MLIFPTIRDPSEYCDGVIYLTNNDEFMFHTISKFELRRSKSYKKCKQMFDENGQFSVWDCSLKHGSKIVKPSTVLYIHSFDSNEHFIELNRILKLFSSNREFWKSRFTNFNVENYPEYFI